MIKACLVYLPIMKKSHIIECDHKKIFWLDVTKLDQFGRGLAQTSPEFSGSTPSQPNPDIRQL